MYALRNFYFDGKNSADFGIVATGSGTYNATERDVEYHSIPGRNGDLIIDNRRYKNQMVPYPVFIHKSFAKNADAAREWLMSAQGYCRLEDDYNPDIFRMASFAGPIDFDMKPRNKAGETTLYFWCKPQRYLKSGEQPVRFSSAGTIHNPTGFDALPLITVHGSGAGVLTVGGIEVEIKSLPSGDLVLDCETCHAYYGTENRNQCIYAPEFPVLAAGENRITWSGGITGVEIIPRWWTL